MQIPVHSTNAIVTTCNNTLTLNALTSTLFPYTKHSNTYVCSNVVMQTDL